MKFAKHVILNDSITAAAFRKNYPSTPANKSLRLIRNLELSTSETVTSSDSALPTTATATFPISNPTQLATIYPISSSMQSTSPPTSTSTVVAGGYRTNDKIALGVGISTRLRTLIITFLLFFRSTGNEKAQRSD